VGRKTKMRRMKSISSHTYQIKGKILRGDASTFVGASEMCGCGLFSPFSF
jgi:hypothetical protein